MSTCRVIEAKGELSLLREKNAHLLHQAGFNEGRAEFLARENEELKRKLADALESLNAIHEKSTTNKENAGNGTNQFVCVFCEKVFTRKWNLKIHLRIHNGEKPFSCNLCGKMFTQRRQLEIHYKKHTGERPHMCDFCNRRFKQKSHLKKHLHSHRVQSSGSLST